MQDIVRSKLTELVGRFGLDLCNDARRCEALLRDVCNEHNREINALATAARDGVGSELRQSSAGVPKELIVARLTKRLHDDFGLVEDLARWAVESWAVALGALGTEELRFPSKRRAILGGEATGAATNEPNEMELRERAFAEPFNPEAVGRWFQHSDDSRAVVDFYNCHHEAHTENWLSADRETFPLCCKAVLHLMKQGRWQDVLEFSDKAIEFAERDGILETPINGASIAGLASCKARALAELGLSPETVAFLREVVARFPGDAMLHSNLSAALSNVLFQAGEDVHCLSALLYGVTGREKKDVPDAKDVVEESVRHALKAAELAPDQCRHVLLASVVLNRKGDYASALSYGKKALALASIDKENFDALNAIAQVYKANDLYSEARSYLRKAMRIDDSNVDVIAQIAFCYRMEGKKREALKMAKHGLMLDPQNKVCQIIRNGSESIP